MTATDVRPARPAADGPGRDVKLPTAHRRAVPRLRLLVLTVTGTALLGGLTGAAVAVATTAYRAEALVDLSSALSAANGGSVASTDQADRFVQSELLYLNSATFRESVARDAGITRSSFALTAAQVGSTDVVQIAAVTDDDVLAERLTDRAVTAYTGYRQDLLTRDARGLETQLRVAQEQLAEARAAGATDLAALRDRVESLQNGIDRIQAVAGSDGAGGTVVERATDSGRQPTTSPVLGAGAGVALGVLLGLLVVAASRLLSRRVSTPDDARETGVPVARPGLPAASGDWLAGLADRRSDDPVESAARLLAARLLGSGAEGRPLVLLGTAPGVGTSFTAVNLAVALARRRPTVLVPAGDVADGRVAEWFGLASGGPGLLDVAGATDLPTVRAGLQPTSVDGLSVLAVRPAARWEPVESALAGPALPVLLAAGWAVVVDCPPSTVSTATFELAPLDPVVGLVVATGRTTGEELADAVDQLRGAGTAPSALVFDEGRAGRRRSRRADAG
jgi:Mrp family chromosome partitioning ATPase